LFKITQNSNEKIYARLCEKKNTSTYTIEKSVKKSAVFHCDCISFECATEERDIWTFLRKSKRRTPSPS
jgi:alpha-L-arabinofuranosidase